MKNLFAVALLSSVFSLAQATTNEPDSTGCLNEAVNHLRHIANYDLNAGFDVSNYMVEEAEGEYPVEPTTVYTFSRSILDAWEVELVTSDCFPIRIEFVGDL